MEFLDEFYETEHLQSIDDAVDDLIIICQKNGGQLAWFSILGGKPIILKYQFDEAYLTDSSLNVLIFEKPDKEWAEFIYKNRTRSTPAFSHDYDIVIGPIADDGVAYLLNRYEEGFCTLEELAKDLKYKKLNRQFFFGTTKSIALLTRIPWYKTNKNI